MKVQAIDTALGERWIVLDRDYRPYGQITRFLKYLDACGRSPNTLCSYAHHLKVYCDFLEREGIAIDGLCKDPDRGPVDILSSYMVYLQYPQLSCTNVIPFLGEQPARGDSTVNVMVSTVLSFYAYLASNGELEELDVYRSQRRNPKFKSFLSELVFNTTELHSSIFKRRTAAKRLEYVTREQYALVLAACNTCRDRLLVALLYEGALRISECLGIRLEDLEDIDQGIVSITFRDDNENGCRVKNRAEGVVYLPGYVIDLLLEYLEGELAPFDSDYLFVTLFGPTAGSPLKVETTKKLFQRIEAKVGFPVHAHMLRHGFATEKLEAGWDLVDIQHYLRHKSMSSTRIYAHETERFMKEQVRPQIEALARQGDGGEDERRLCGRI